MELETADYKDLRGIKTHQTFWKSFAGTVRADTIDADQLTRWSAAWRRDGLSAGRVNRRISALLRGFKLGKKQGLVNAIPEWTALKEAPPRSGTRTWQEFVAVRAALPPHARIPVSIEYWLGTRSGETHALEWSQVRFHHREQTVEIRLQAIDTKTGEQRVAVLGGDLYEVLRDWHVFTKAEYPKCSTVCHYHGDPLESIRTAWQTACVKTGLGRWLHPDGKEVGNRKYRGALLHDFRRTAVGNMEDAGVPRKVAMAISGHKTDSGYRRYHIVKKSDLIDAGKRLLEHHQREHGASSTPSAPEPSSKKVFS